MLFTIAALLTACSEAIAQTGYENNPQPYMKNVLLIVAVIIVFAIRFGAKKMFRKHLAIPKSTDPNAPKPPKWATALFLMNTGAAFIALMYLRFNYPRYSPESRDPDIMYIKFGLLAYLLVGFLIYRNYVTRVRKGVK